MSGATNDCDDFELNVPDTINKALLEHLKSIHDSRSMHVNDSQNLVSQCLQEARSQVVIES